MGLTFGRSRVTIIVTGALIFGIIGALAGMATAKHPAVANTTNSTPPSSAVAATSATDTPSTTIGAGVISPPTDTAIPQTNNNGGGNPQPPPTTVPTATATDKPTNPAITSPFNGTIASIGTNSFIVRTSVQGVAVSVTVSVSASTVFTGNATSFNNLRTGWNVSVTGTVTSPTTLDATRVNSSQPDN